MKRYTNKEVAEMAGVSPAAVSLAINGKKGVSEETRARIMSIVEHVNYLPNPNSRRLLSSRTNNIAVLVRNDMCAIDRLFYTELTESILNTCDHKVTNLVFSTLQQHDGHSMLPQLIRSRDVDGILIYGDIDSNVLLEITNYEIPFVTLDSSLHENKHLTVGVDYSMAAYTATQYLLKCGHRDIAYIGNSANSQKHFNYAVFSGFQRALTEVGVVLPVNRIQINVYDENALYDSIQQTLGGAVQPTALFCATDVYGCHAIRYLRSLGYAVPDDISVIGIDDIVISQFTTPALTTVCVDLQTIGREGYHLLQRRIAGESCESILLPSEQLIIRDSVKIL